MKKEREFSAKNLAKVVKLEKDLDLERSAREALETGMASKIKEAELRKETKLGQKVKDAEIRAADAEKKATGLEKEVADLKNLLEERKEPKKVIADFRESAAYGDALAQAAAAEVVRCWHVAERYIKTDPEASLQSFVEHYLAAKDKIKSGKGEPEPYKGPSPSFISPIVPDPEENLEDERPDSPANSDPAAD